jgi:DNA-binding MarR family transcriptional regulator
MPDEWDESDPVDATALAWLRERPGTPVAGIGIVTRIWRLAKLLGEDRRATLAEAGADAATLDLLSVLRRSGHPYRLSTRQLAERSRVTAGAISQRVARAEAAGLVNRTRSQATARGVTVTLTEAGHGLVERLVDRVLGREAELVSGLTEDQQATLTALLRSFLAELEATLDRPDHTQVGTP